MAVIKKIRPRWWWPFSWFTPETVWEPPQPVISFTAPEAHYEVRPLTLAHLDEVFRLDQRCFLDGEAYTRETLDYLLTASHALAYRSVTGSGQMTGFVIGLVEEDWMGHVTTLGVAPEHRRRGLAGGLMEKIEKSFQQRGVRMVRLEVRSINTSAVNLYRSQGYVVTQRLHKYYANGGDGFLMIKSLE
jgi:ribosomal protein S18 acetylase RimI-like enzyme